VQKVNKLLANELTIKNLVIKYAGVDRIYSLDERISGMNLKNQFRMFGLAVLLVMALAACGGGGGGSAASGSLTLGTNGEALAYDKTALTAKAGEVKIAFTNGSAAQQHNVVIVKGGEAEAAKVDEAAVAAGAPTYLPADKSLYVAATAMLAGKASETLTANLEAGTYTYICTYPGHYAAGMKGTLTVQ
jgi:plastocyanin